MTDPLPHLRAKVDDNWPQLSTGTEDQRKTWLLLLLIEVRNDARAEGLNDGARIATDAACEAIGRAPAPEAIYPPHEVNDPDNLAPALLAAMSGGATA